MVCACMPPNTSEQESSPHHEPQHWPLAISIFLTSTYTVRQVIHGAVLALGSFHSWVLSAESAKGQS
jgi:hypothetical protein